jgi:hypothetical protein
MRVGDNVAKRSEALPPFGRHRVILPVYIPSLDEYFAKAIDVLHLCLESLRLTTQGIASITVISNGSAPAVEDDLVRLYRAGWIDQLAINRRNWGKVDAVVGAARATFEELITIADCDVLFMPGWMEAVEEVFRQFPECGVASPAPNPRLSWYYASATILGALVKRELGYEKVVPEIDLDRFAASIGSSELFTKGDRGAQMVVKRNGAAACVGCGHFVFTIRRGVLAAVPPEPACDALGGRAHEMWLDRPADVLGLWRLATTRAYAHHIGNMPEAWMYEALESIVRDGNALSGVTAPLPDVRRGWPSRVPLRLRLGLVSALRRLRVVGIGGRGLRRGEAEHEA